MNGSLLLYCFASVYCHVISYTYLNLIVQCLIYLIVYLCMYTYVLCTIHVLCRCSCLSYTYMHNRCSIACNALPLICSANMYRIHAILSYVMKTHATIFVLLYLCKIYTLPQPCIFLYTSYLFIGHL